uniref:Uncharacterized protein n=1 Tax=Magallana gigas TaxID=29159 RepID=A0A8W8MK79_MAGGI
MVYKSAQPHFTQSFEDDGETPMFVVERNDDYKIRKAQYSIKMSFFNRKVYFHIQNNVRGTSTSLPEEVMMAIADMGEELSAARDVLKNLQPPSPPMLRITPPKKRKVTIVDDDNDGEFF